MSRFKRYLNIDERTLKAIEEVILKGYFKKRFKERFKILRDLNKKLSSIYKTNLCEIKVVPYWNANKSKSQEFIFIGDQLSLVIFLATFKSNLDFQKKNTDSNEVKIKRDNFDWALSIIESNNEDLIKKIFKAKEKAINLEEERKEFEEELKHTIQLKGGKR